MEDILRADVAGRAGLQSERPTVGLVFAALNDNHAFGAVDGAVDAAQEGDANLFCFAIADMQSRWYERIGGPQHGRYVLLDLIGPESVDGLVAFQWWQNSESCDHFYKLVRPLPLVNAVRHYEGYPGTAIDNSGSMREAIVHLIETHGRHHIAFVGYEEERVSLTFKMRYHAYLSALEEYGIPHDPQLVFPLPRSPEDFTAWLDERGLQPGVDFDAAVAFSDERALYTLEALKRRGTRVPEQVALIGVDDIRESSVSTPPLATVKMPRYDLSHRSVEILLSSLRGEEVPRQILMPAPLVTRRSCGCWDPTIVQAGELLEGQIAGGSLDTAFTARRATILAEIARAAGDDVVVAGWAGQLLDEFVAQVTTRRDAGSAEDFMSAFDGILRQSAAAGIDPIVWHGALSALRRYTLPYLDNVQMATQIETVWQQARLVIGEAARRVQLQQQFENQQRAEALDQLNATLATTFDRDELIRVLVEGLPRLGIPSCYLSLYVDRETVSEGARLIMAYNEGGQVDLPPGGLTFPSRQLVPQGLLPGGRRYIFVVEPLYFQQMPLGFVLFEVGPREWPIYEGLQAQISSALQGMVLVTEVERRAVQLEVGAEVSRTVTSVFEVDRLLRQTVDLLGDRLGFYYTGIFLLDEPGEWAVLRVGTGEAGAQMLADEHRLAVDESSMVGWTALRRQPRIALDVGKEAVRFDNPLLPETRSEMTLPLMVGVNMVGVLNVQSAEAAAFSQEDVQVLQGVADQIAIAIENARLIADEARVLEASSPIYRASRQLTTATTTTDVADAIIASVTETGADGCTVVGFEFSSSGEPEALLYLGAWRRDREPQFQPGLRLPIAESPFPIEMVSTLWSVGDVDTDERLPRSARVVFQSTGAKALVNIPLRSGERVIGQVVVIRATPGPFAESALRLYEVLSDQAAIALERAQLLEDAQRRAVREQQTRQMIDRIRRSMDLEQALQAAAEELAEVVGVSRVSIDLGVNSSAGDDGH